MDFYYAIEDYSWKIPASASTRDFEGSPVSHDGVFSHPVSPLPTWPEVDFDSERDYGFVCYYYYDDDGPNARSERVRRWALLLLPPSSGSFHPPLMETMVTSESSEEIPPVSIPFWES